MTIGHRSGKAYGGNFLGACGLRNPTKAASSPFGAVFASDSWAAAVLVDELHAGRL